MIAGYEKTQTFRLGSESGWGEDFVQRVIGDDPAVLGLGDLVLKKREHRQRGGGRLDFLLQDSPPTKRYEVEIQLGDTDPSHIIRTIEYWDHERRNTPQIDHIAVIVAEGITSRFYNVISLFNQHIPLIAIKMSGIMIGSQRSLLFTKVLDYSAAEVEDEESGIQETDRPYWEKKSSASTMQVVDTIIGISKKVDPRIGPRFNKGSIPLKIGAEFWRFITLWPKKNFVKMSLPVSQSDSVESRLGSAGIDFDTYDALRNRYLLTITSSDLPKNDSLLQALISEAYTKAQGATEQISTE